jgi:hypothetical protein
MKRLIHFLTVLLLLSSIFECASSTSIAQWDYPFPEVPPGKPPEKKKWYAEGDFRRDAIEKNPRHKEVFEAIGAEVDAAVQNHPNRDQFGFGHVWQETKRRILYWKYGIDWHPVSMMTPGVMMD